MNVDEFLYCSTPILDVRSPSEYLQGHIPGALSFPLFSDAERAQVGTLYKTVGKEAAVRLGLQIVGPKLASFVENAEVLVGVTKDVRLYCWRGGMRSGSVAWLLQTTRFRPSVLQGGYKAFRNWSLNQFKKKYFFRVLGGFTGSGKTEQLHLLREQNKQIIDLEALAEHRGSSFGHLGQLKQPSTEQFENRLAMQLLACDISQPIWIEDESRRIGSCHIPQDIWEQMKNASFLWLQSPKEERVKRLMRDYGDYTQEDLVFSTQRLAKKLGGVLAEKITQAVKNEQLENAISLILDYYDQSYLYSCKRHRQVDLDFSLCL